MIFMLLKRSRTAGVMTGGLGAAVTLSETITPNSWDLSVIYDTVCKGGGGEREKRIKT